MKRNVDESDDSAKKLKANAEQRAEESKRPGEGLDFDHLDITKEIGAVSLGESDVKFNEAAFGFVNSICENIEEMYYEAISGEVL